MSYGEHRWGFDFTGGDLEQQQGHFLSWIRIDLLPEDDQLKLQVVEETTNFRTTEKQEIISEYWFTDRYENPQDFLNSIVSGLARLRTECSLNIEAGCLKCETMRDIARSIRTLIEKIEQSRLDTSNFNWEAAVQGFDEEAETEELNRFIEEYREYHKTIFD